MTAAKTFVPLGEFARAMREGGGEFDQAVRRFASRFGAVGNEMLSVLAQAAFLCWVNVEAERDLLAICRAIERGAPTSQHYHCQITPQRWIEMHAYLIGIQRWLGVAHAVPPQIDTHKVEQIAAWLGPRTPAKAALAKLLLMRLVDDLLNYASFATLGRAAAADSAAYPDFSRWYFAADGSPYAVPRIGQDDRRPFAGAPFKAQAERLAGIVRAEMPSRPGDAEALIDYLTRQTQPPCMHRFSRYLDVQITSIGALRLRGNLPPDTVPKAAWQAFRSQAQDALRAWADGIAPDGERAERIYAALGAPSKRKRVIVRDFLLGGYFGEGDAAGWHWLVPRAQTRGTNAYTTFRLHGILGAAGLPGQESDDRGGEA